MNWTSKCYLFFGIFFLFISGVFLLPHFALSQNLVNHLNIFVSGVQNFIFFLAVAAVAAFMLTGLFCFICRKLHGRTRSRLRLGETLIALGLITRENLEKALRQQQLRIGEILVSTGHITPGQRDYALMAQQKHDYKLGEILKRLGFATEKDIQWALKLKRRKLGMILQQLKMITENDIAFALNIQKISRTDKNGNIILNSY